MNYTTTTIEQVKLYKNEINKILSQAEELRPDLHQALIWVKHFWNRYIQELLAAGDDVNYVLKKLNQREDIQISSSVSGTNDLMNITFFVLDESNLVQFLFSFDFHPKALQHIKKVVVWYNNQVKSI